MKKHSVIWNYILQRRPRNVIFYSEDALRGKLLSREKYTAFRFSRHIYQRLYTPDNSPFINGDAVIRAQYLYYIYTYIRWYSEYPISFNIRSMLVSLVVIKYLL